MAIMLGVHMYATAASFDILYNPPFIIIPVSDAT
jgi:hypothetical protein